MKPPHLRGHNEWGPVRAPRQAETLWVGAGTRGGEGGAGPAGEAQGQDVRPWGQGLGSRVAWATLSGPASRARVSGHSGRVAGSPPLPLPPLHWESAGMEQEASQWGLEPQDVQSLDEMGPEGSLKGEGGSAPLRSVSGIGRWGCDLWERK